MSEHWIEREHESILQTYKRLPVTVDYALGARVFDINGNSYLDFLGGIAVNALGHCHPKTIEAIENQLHKYMHISNYFYQKPQIELAEKLKSMTGFSRVFFCNSGTEAIEGALKLVRRWGNQINKTNIISFRGGFHGRTYGALSLMDKPNYKDGMEPFLKGITILDYNNVKQLDENIGDKTCAVFLEFLQGEGGITTATKEFVEKIKSLQNQFGFLIVADEIQSGTGRTGKFFAFDHYDINPDVATLAKGVGGGLPLGCILAKESLSDVWGKGMHGTTYGGNALACVAGLTVLNELENGLLKNVVEIGNYLREKLESAKSKFPKLIVEVRGLGMMAGMLLTFDAIKLVDLLLDKGVLTNAASGTVLRLVPPLIIGKKEVDEFYSLLIDSLDIIQNLKK